jgi:hypothetical protein
VSSVEEDNQDGTPLAIKFFAWTGNGTPQEQINFSYDKHNTPTLKNDDTIPETSCTRYMEPQVPSLSQMVRRYKPFTNGLKIQGHLQKTRNWLLNTATKWAGNLKARSKAQDHNTSTTTFPGPNKADNTGANPSPYDKDSPVKTGLKPDRSSTT